MKDTSTEAERRFQALVMSLSPAERLAMACRMFATAKTLVESGIRHACGELEARDLRRKVFLRFYAGDFSQAEEDKILSRL